MNPNAIPTLRTLNTTVSRAVDFLRTAANRRIVFSLLSTRGFSRAAIDQGWDLVHKACGHVGPATIDAMDRAATDALQQLDANDEPMFSVISACLIHDYPEQHDYLFAGNLAPATGAYALETNALMLDRLDGLEKGEERKASHKQDKAAIAKLAERGITAEERKRLRALLEVAKGGNLAPLPLTSNTEEVNLDDPRTRDLINLYAWYHEWSAVARAVIKRRDLLVALGLARPRASKVKTPEEPKPA